ncbi:MFS transporter [Mycolicibacterium komossense]|uniref:MFS transporter n=2 Tax=Mycolicibacterium komossense TaxID=1779 RepID=A0ABT3C716_9MYCO|nr:MFS transporter [Mycolicibacterium komossense]
MPGLPSDYRPWPALWAMVAGIFMILVDSTIVSVAADAIWVDLDTDLNSVVWVTSGYLLAYVVPLLLSGRLGDMFGPKRVYLVGLVVFTAASAWCGLSGSAEMLIMARVVQGLGAALMAPQTMSLITRSFPTRQRGTAMALWGAVGGVAILVGPLAGGVLVDQFGWQSVFFINVPFGLAALIAALVLVPNLPAMGRRIDYFGILLSGAGLFLVVFGVQEGQRHDWSHVGEIGPVPVSIWGLIGSGLILLAVFLWWQTRSRDPLMTLALFSDRNFSVCSVAVACMGFSLTGMAVPAMLYAQKSLGLSATRSAMLLIPMALFAAGLAGPAGKLADRVHPRYVTGFGFAITAIALAWLGYMAADMASVREILWPISLVGVGNAFIWGPLTATANRNLDVDLAGVGSGVYNTTRQVGGVLGSAIVGVFMQRQVDRYIPAVLPPGAQQAAAHTLGALPDVVRGPFAHAMGTSLYVPAIALAVGFVVVQFLTRARPE